MTIVSARNRDVDAQLTLEPFECMPQIVVSLTGRAVAAYDSALDEQGIKRRVFLTTPHFLIVPLLLEQHPDLIATVPLELANVFERYGTVCVLRPPVELAPFALNQHWHPRFHRDPAIIWLRDLMKRTFTDYPEVQLGESPSEPDS